MSGCERCRGTGFEAVTLENGVESVRVCGCRRTQGEGSAERLLQTLRIPPRYQHCLLSEFQTADSSLKASALMKVMKYCSDYPSRGGSKSANDRGLGLLFTGGNGTGKTHLAVAALRELASAHGVVGQFWDYHELLREIRNSYDPSTSFTEYEVLEPIINMPVLLLDDLGAWKMTDWMNDTLFYVLNKRYLATRPTLITTNYPDREPSAKEVQEADTSVRREYLIDRIGLRLRSRLQEACAVIRLEGQDVRQAFQASNQSLLV